LLGMKIGEVPTTLSPDGRGRPPHLRTWRDGWRTLRFFLLYSPRWLFLYPGLALMFVGIVVGGWLMPGPRKVQNVVFDVHTLLYAAIAILLGFQSVAFAVFAKLFAISEGLHPPDEMMERLFPAINLERGLLLGGALTVVGFIGSVLAVRMWGVHGFGPLDFSHSLRVVIPSVLALTLGVQTVFCSFFLSVLGMRRK
jgi:hypothetical protein